MNSQAFTPEEVKKGLHLKLINTLLEINEGKENFYNQILLDTDGYCLIVYWVEVSYEYSDASFKFVDDDEVVAKELQFPDGHYELEYKECAEERIKEWHKEHPEYVKNEYGIWTEVETNNLYNNNVPKQMSLEDFDIEV